MPSVLKADNLAKSYDGRQVVLDVSLEVSSREIVGLLGPNGAGKTTCFYMILGLVSADKGQVSLDDLSLTHLPIHARAKAGVGYLPQEASIFRRLTVKDNVLAILETRKDLSRKQRTSVCMELLDEFSVGHLANTLGQALSGGERRRVEIARALALDPAFVLLDEPFAGVDPISINEIKTVIRHLFDRGIGVLITDHNVRETLKLVDRAYIIHQGQVLCEGSAEFLAEDPKAREVYLGPEFNL